MKENLIDRIYECAFTPELWPQVLDEMAELSGACGGTLISANRQTQAPDWIASESLLGLMNDYMRGKFYASVKATNSLMDTHYPGFLRNIDVVSSSEMKSDPIYRDLLWPAGLGDSVSTAMSTAAGDMLVCVLHRKGAQGPADIASVGRLDALRPHIARSGFMSARLRHERAQSMAQALDLIGLPGLLFDSDGRVLAANAAMESDSRVRWRAWNQVEFVDRAANELFRRAVKAIDDDEQPVARSFAVRDADQVATKVAHVLPIRGASRDLFARSAGVLTLTSVALPNAPDVELIQSLFGLTPAEASVAQGLTRGRTLRHIAENSRVSANTVRTHLRGVLQKTGCRRQAELVGLLSSLGPPGA